MLVLVTRMIASLGSLIAGSGTLSTDTFRRPCHVTARIGFLSKDLFAARGVPTRVLTKPRATIGIWPTRDRRRTAGARANGTFPPICGHSGFWIRVEYQEAVTELETKVTPAGIETDISGTPPPSEKGL